MYVDDTVVASFLVIGGTLIFLGGLARFIIKDSKKSK